jgi:hypothetical protein
VAALAADRSLATRTDIRLGSVGDGCLVLRGPSGDAEVEHARHALLGVSGVVDVRSDASDAPVSPLAGAGTASGRALASQR